jgi:hypothetical protein
MTTKAPTPCTDIRDLFYSQARAAALLGERTDMSSKKIDTDRLARLMAAFENGEVFRDGNPFDVDDPLAFGTSKAAAMCAAFAEMARNDTPRVTGVTAENHATALVVAGLLQGMWIGYEYAHRDVYGDES